MQYILMDCVTEKQKDRLSGVFIQERTYNKEDLEQYELPFKLVESIAELRKANITPLTIVLGVEVEGYTTQEKTAVDSGIIFDKNMSLNDFLSKNTKVRTVEELSEYFSMEVINRAERVGLFVKRKNLIIF